MLIDNYSCSEKFDVFNLKFNWSLAMYFHACKYIYLTYFNGEIIVLNLRKDQYILLLENVSEVVYMALNNQFIQKQGRYVLADNKNLLPEDFDESISYLQEIGILSDKNYNHPYSKALKKGKVSAGASNIDWRMSSSDLDNKVPKKMILEAYFLLIKVYFILKVFGLYSLIKAIKRNGRNSCIEKDSKEFSVLVTALNKACFYFPVKTKCLEWSAALIFMALRRKWKCNIEIGIQNLPFAAHAWVKANDEVIADTADLPETLSVILSEPFIKEEVQEF